jgi:hypothetical protein
MTATPKPAAVWIFLETAKKVHIPKKNESAIFSMKIALTKRLR